MHLKLAQKESSFSMVTPPKGSIKNGPHSKSLMPPPTNDPILTEEVQKVSARIVPYKMDVNAKIKMKVNARQRKKEAFRDWYNGSKKQQSS